MVRAMSAPVLVGQATERARLREAVGTTGPDRPRLVLASGEAGMGKTRLVSDTVAWAGHRGMTVLEAGCLPMGDALPYAPFVEMLGPALFGVGVGYLEPEFRALNVPLAGRGARTDEYLEAIEAIWAQDSASFDGRFVSFTGMRAEPRPWQRPTPPLHVGGYVRAAYRRAVTRGHGWYGFALDLPATERAVASLRHAEEEHRRPPDLGALEISVTPDPSLELDERTVAAFADLSVTRLVALPPRRARQDAAALLAYVDDVTERLADRIQTA